MIEFHCIPFELSKRCTIHSSSDNEMYALVSKEGQRIEGHEGLTEGSH